MTRGGPGWADLSPPACAGQQGRIEGRGLQTEWSVGSSLSLRCEMHAWCSKCLRPLWRSPGRLVPSYDY